MKSQSTKLFATFMTIAFVFVSGLSFAQEVSGQRYLTEIKDTGDVKGLAQFAENLSNFLTLAEKAEAQTRLDPALLKQLEAAAKKVKDGTSNVRNNLKGLVSNFKTKNQWNDELDAQFNDSLGSLKVKGFFQRNGARKILNDADAAFSALNGEIDAIMVIAVKKSVSSFSGGSVFNQTSFAPTSSARKVKVKCVALGIAIFGAELLKAKKTAENLDGFFDKGCGAGATTAT